MNAHRKVTADSPLNLSSFYLPNVAAPFGGSLPANVLAPSVTNLGGLAGQMMFWPAFNQPFVAYQFISVRAGRFGVVNVGAMLDRSAAGLFHFTIVASDAGQFHG